MIPRHVVVAYDNFASFGPDELYDGCCGTDCKYVHVGGTTSAHGGTAVFRSGGSGGGDDDYSRSHRRRHSFITTEYSRRNIVRTSYVGERRPRARGVLCRTQVRQRSCKNCTQNIRTHTRTHLTLQLSLAHTHAYTYGR